MPRWRRSSGYSPRERGIRKQLAFSKLDAPAESVTPQGAVGAVAELLAAAAQVGAMRLLSRVRTLA